MAGISCAVVLYFVRMISQTDNTDVSRPKLPIVFYDGDCGFCNGSVRFIIKHEKAPTMLFAPVPGETAQETFSHSGLPGDIGNNSIVVFDNGRFFIRFQAVRRIMELMGKHWLLGAKVLKVIPTPLGDLAYRIVARYRKKLPAGASCELLPEKDRRRFLP